MSLSSRLEALVAVSPVRIGEIEIAVDESVSGYSLYHVSDRALAGDTGNLRIYDDPTNAREISTYAKDGTYRFAKGQVNLNQGWMLKLETIAQVQVALDLFYPAALGMYFAKQEGRLEIENLRPKLDRQTGMYRFAKTISDDGAQKLVEKICGPAHQCARKILWQIDEATPLAESPASRYDGIPFPDLNRESIPLLCREACNHFVTECRNAAREEFAKKPE